MTEETELPPFTHWAVVELMGHKRLAGLVSQETLFDSAFMRLDVPREDGTSVTQWYSPASIYCLTPVSEDIARSVAKREMPSPVRRWELPTVDVDDDDIEDY